jgi:hypothetical protein
MRSLLSAFSLELLSYISGSTSPSVPTRVEIDDAAIRTALPLCVRPDAHQHSARRHREEYGFDVSVIYPSTK